MLFLAQIEQLKDVAQGNEYTLTGILVLALAALCWVVYTSAVKVLDWASIRVDKIIEQGVKHLNTVDATMESLKTAIQSIHPRLDHIETKISDMNDRVDNINTFLRDRHDIK